MLTAVIVVFPLMVLLIMVGHYTISSIRNDIKIMKKSIYYVVESKESAYVFKSIIYSPYSTDRQAIISLSSRLR